MNLPHPFSRRSGSRLVAALGGILVTGLVLAGCNDPTAGPAAPPSDSSSVVVVASSTASTVASTPVTAANTAPASSTASTGAAAVPAARPPAAAPAPAACGAGYYRNVSGNCVHDPEQAPSPPAGATARCTDGTYSFSQHRQGTCSGHGGVAEWL